MDELPISLEAENSEAVQFPEANAVAVHAIASTLRSTYGPVPIDKLVIKELAKNKETADPRQVAVDDFAATSDGATILEKLPVEHPIGPIVRRLGSKKRPGDTDIEGKDIPDGTTTAVLLMSALLREAGVLLDQGVHPQDIRLGYQSALSVTESTIDDLVRSIDSFGDREAVRRGVARTAMTGNDVGGVANEWVPLVCNAVDRVGRIDEETFVVRQVRAGSISDSQLVSGAVLDRNKRSHRRMPEKKEDATVLVLGGRHEGGLRDPDVNNNMAVNYDDPTDHTGFELTGNGRRQSVVSSLQDAGVDVIVAQQGIDKHYGSILAREGILGVDGVIPLDLRQLCLATGAKPLFHVDDLTAENLGYAGSVRHETIEPYRNRRKSRRMVVFDDCRDVDSVAVILYGMFGQLEEQATTEIRKGAAALALAEGHMGRQPGVLPGGGATKLQIADRVREAALTKDGREQLGMNGYADALDRVVRTLIGNAGLDGLARLADLRATQTGTSYPAMSLPSGEIVDAFEVGILDAAATQIKAIRQAVHVTNLLLGIDDALDATFSMELNTDDVNYDLEAERHEDHVEANDTVWET